MIRSRLLKLYVLLWQTGAGTQESSPKDIRGSQPPRQYAPTPHCPYSVYSKISLLADQCSSREDHSREQQGVSEGHFLVRLQDGGLAAKAVDAVAKAAMNVDARTIIYVGCR
jgi:hypothetical protein